MTDGDSRRLAEMSEAARGWSDFTKRIEAMTQSLLAKVTDLKRDVGRIDKHLASTDKRLDAIERGARERTEYLHAVEDEAEAAAEEAHRVARVQADHEAAQAEAMRKLTEKLDALSREGVQLRASAPVMVAAIGLIGTLLVTLGPIAVAIIERMDK